MLVLAAHSVTERVDRPRVLELPEDERDLVLEQRALLLVAETRLTAAIRDSHSQSGNQRQSAAISGHQRPSEAVTCNQRQSEAIGGHQQTNRVRHLG